MAEAANKNFVVVMTTGTNDPLKTELAVLNAFSLRKNGHNVQIVMMGEAGSVIDEEIITTCNGFGLPHMDKILNDDVMAEVTWSV